MLSAVWVAVVVAAAFWVTGVCVAVYVMLRAARLMAESSAALGSLLEREDLLIERASAVIEQAGDQIAKTETITASMGDVSASMAELRGRLTALAPPPQARADGPGGTLTWVAALVYGLARALGLRWAARGRLAPVTARRAALTGRRGGASP